MFITPMAPLNSVAELSNDKKVEQQSNLAGMYLTKQEET